MTINSAYALDPRERAAHGDLRVRWDRKAITVRRIKVSDLTGSLSDGLADFMARPTHMIFLCIIYPIAGLLIAAASAGTGLLPSSYPLIAGFALVGPLASIGAVEMSRLRERNSDRSLRQVREIVRSPSFLPICGLAVVLVSLFGLWIGTADLLYRATLGPVPAQSLAGFARQIATTHSGWTLAVVGNAAGFGFALVALSIGLVSVPLLLDRDVGLAKATATSARCVATNPLVILAWGLIVAGILAAAMLPLFVGLAVALPVLGHATWHLYRRLVAPV